MAPHSDSRNKLLDAAVTLIRTRGYEATRVDDVCAAAGVTKGSFFHHFKTKEDLAHAAAQRFADRADALFAGGAIGALQRASSAWSSASTAGRCSPARPLTRRLHRWRACSATSNSACG